jgi:TPP-dependent pyruvate/acetoin dehydrogenase alpha subunit
MKSSQEVKKNFILLKKKELQDFEIKIAKDYENRKIKGPIHLSKGNEIRLIKIFSDIKKDDWVFCSWRNHLHALLHGVQKKLIERFIYSGKSMSISSKKPLFLSSSIVGGIIPIALGVALGIKKARKKNKVWCFIGDMTAETGTFWEVYKYSRNYKLPLNFIIEDNCLSTNTPTSKAWGRLKFNLKIYKDVIYYKYKNFYPHHGTGKWVLF